MKTIYLPGVLNSDDNQMCMDVSGGNTGNRNTVQAWPCGGYKPEAIQNQQWHIVNAPPNPPGPPSSTCDTNPRYCPGGSDYECVLLGGNSPCQKCDTTTGSRFMCVEGTPDLGRHTCGMSCENSYECGCPDCTDSCRYCDLSTKTCIQLIKP